MELLNYILNHFWTMAIMEVICLLLIIVFPFVYWINERKDEKTFGQFYTYLNKKAEGWLIILGVTLIPYLNIGIVLFVYTAFVLMHIRMRITNSSIYKKLTNKLSNIRIR